MRYGSVVEAVNRIISEYTMKLTVRQIYYRLISPPYQLFQNTSNNYKSFDKILTRARERKDVDWTKIEDRARSTLGGDDIVFDSPERYIDWIFSGLNETYFQRSMWEEQPSYVEVWVEKDALSALFQAALKEYGVVLFPSRGYSSFTKVMEGLNRFPEFKEVKILHFSDHDPSGLDMTRDLSSRFVEYSESEDSGGLVVKRVALDIGQVRSLNLPSNPTKKADSRAKEYIDSFGDAYWELDAVPSDTLTRWVRGAVDKEIDGEAWGRAQQMAGVERQKLAKALSMSKGDIEALKEKVKNALGSDVQSPPL